MKTRNLFFGMLAIAGMLAASSCVKESINVPEGNDIVASFTINATDAIATKATIGDGTTVDKVACAVYDANGAEMTDLRQVVDVNGKTAYYSTRLAKGQAYRVAFFAYNEAANAYDLTDMKSIKINSACSNVEGRDAFTNFVDIAAEETVNAYSKDVTLYRPFAQLNLGVDAQELADAAKAGVVVSNTQVTVTNVYDAFSAYDNAVASDAVLGTCTYALNGVPTEKLVVNSVEYTYLALNYLLVGDKGAEKSLTDVEFVWTTADGKTNNPTTHFVNIPVQRNYRTNIIGKLLTNPAEFNISIDAEFDGEYVENVVTVTNNVVTTASELQAAINAAVEGQNIITFGANIGGAIVVNQKKDVQILIDGQGKAFTGTFLVNGGSEWGGIEGLSLQNIEFVANTMSNAVDIITVGENSATSRYAHNVTVTDCTFVPLMPGSKAENSVVIRAYQANDITVVNCEASGFHSFAQITGGTNVKFEQVTSSCVRGISLGSATNCVVSNCEITATGAEKYGVRHSADSGADALKLNSNTINAFIPVVVRHTNTTPVTNYQLVFEGANVLTMSGEYHVAIAEQEYDTAGKALTALPNVTVTGADAAWVIFK